MTVTFGVIGCGYISKKHLEAIARCQNAKLIALSDLDRKRMNEAEKYYKDHTNVSDTVYQYEHYKEMLSNDEVDAVTISSISGLHAEMAKAALMAGKHVMLEKPMTLSIEDADEIIQLAKRNDRKVMICHQLRFRPIMQKIKAIIADGKLGMPYLGVASIRINRSQAYYQAASWRGDWEHDGGMLVNQGIHLVDLMQWFLGDVEQVYGEITSVHLTKETEDAAIGVLTFKNRAKGVIEANVVTQPDNIGYSLSLFFEHGTISIEGPTFNQMTRWFVNGEKADVDELHELMKDNQERTYMYQNFIQAIQSNEPLLVDGSEGKKALETIFALYQSSLKQQSIKLPLHSFSTSHMKKQKG